MSIFSIITVNNDNVIITNKISITKYRADIFHSSF